MLVRSVARTRIYNPYRSLSLTLQVPPVNPDCTYCILWTTYIIMLLSSHQLLNLKAKISKWTTSHKLIELLLVDAHGRLNRWPSSEHVVFRLQYPVA